MSISAPRTGASYLRPFQINYVLIAALTQSGYLVESKRGGGAYRIYRVDRIKAVLERGHEKIADGGFNLAR